MSEASANSNTISNDSDNFEVEDFSNEPVATNGHMIIKPYKEIEHKREDVRAFLAKAVFWLLVTVLVILVILYSFKNKPISEIKDISLVILTPIIGIVGTVFGFYFGSNK